MTAITIKLKEEELQKIKALTKKGVEDVRVVTRALILKSRHIGMSTESIVELLDVAARTVTNTLNNYQEFGFEKTIYEAPRTGRPINFDDRDKANIVAMVCSNPPDGYARWTLELIAEESVNRRIVDNISKSKIQVILEEHELKPWREKMWCVPRLDEEYIQRMEAILSIYEREYKEDTPVVCFDEKPVALIADKHQRTASSPGKEGKKDYEYKRNGSANVFCAVEPLAGRYINKTTINRKSPELAKFLKGLTRVYKSAEKIVLIMDNLNTHTKKSLTDFYGEKEGEKIWNRFAVYFTPKHASWLNQAEIAIGMYSRQCLGDGRVGDFNKLKTMTKHWNKSINRKKTQIQWEFNRQKARKKFDYEYPIGKN